MAPVFGSNETETYSFSRTRGSRDSAGAANVRDTAMSIADSAVNSMIFLQESIFSRLSLYYPTPASSVGQPEAGLGPDVGGSGSDHYLEVSRLRHPAMDSRIIVR